jgi:outer membrane receptor protein involved in Fe transport
VPINDAFSGFVQWSRVPNELVKQVELVRGGGSTVWGTYATSGVVNIVTREPSAREYALDAGYGELNTVRADGFAPRRLSDALTIAGNANWYDTDGFNAVPEDQRRPLDVPTAFKAGHANLQGNFTAGPRLVGFVRGQYFHDRQTLGTPLAVNHQDSWDVSGGADKTAAGGEFAFRGYYHHGLFMTDNVGTPEGVETRFAEYVQNRHTTDSSSVGLSLQYSRRLSATVPQLAVGVDYRLVGRRPRRHLCRDRKPDPHGHRTRQGGHGRGVRSAERPGHDGARAARQRSLGLLAKL